jgi:hypothetical protein
MVQKQRCHAKEGAEQGVAVSDKEHGHGVRSQRVMNSVVRFELSTGFPDPVRMKGKTAAPFVSAENTYGHPFMLTSKLLELTIQSTFRWPKHPSRSVSE